MIVSNLQPPPWVLFSGIVSLPSLDPSSAGPHFIPRSQWKLFVTQSISRGFGSLSLRLHSGVCSPCLYQSRVGGQGLCNTSRLRLYNSKKKNRGPRLCRYWRPTEAHVWQGRVTEDGSWVVVMQVQVTIVLGAAFAVRNMRNLPRRLLKLLKWTGVNLVPDLTIADPTWILPVAWTIFSHIGEYPDSAWCVDSGGGLHDTASRSCMNGLRLLSALAIT